MSESSTDSVITTTVTTTSTSLTTSFSTTVTITDTTTSTPEDTTPPPTVTSETTLPPSTTVVEPTTEPTSIPVVTSTITQTPTAPGDTQPPSVVVVTSTYSAPGSDPNTATESVASTVSSPSPTASTLSASGSGSGSSGGLSNGAKIAIAVIIPVAVIAGLFFLGLFLWRKRKARKNAEEQRKNEMAEYGFNPNSDPTLVAAGGAYTENQSETLDDNSGYRGWGATSSNRKTSTTLGSNGRVAGGGMAVSESSSQPGGYTNYNAPNGGYPDQYAADPMMKSHPEGGDGVAALGGLQRNRSAGAGIRRGPSNASSAYSEGHQSEESDRPSLPGGPYYQEEAPYNVYNDAAPTHGPYGDGSYGGPGQPVIRDVQARRNTRIERAPTFPQQGGISQNF